MRSIRDLLRERARRNAELWQAWNEGRRRQITGLQALSDEDLIAAAEARTSLSHPDAEMEMQRRLKVAIQELTREAGRARRSANWIGVFLIILTVVLVVLTVVLAVGG